MSNNQWRSPPGGQYPQQPGGQYAQQQPPPRGQYPPQQGQFAPPPQQGQFAPPPPPWQQGPQYGGPTGPNHQLPHGLGWGQPPGGPRPPKKKRNPAVVVLVLLGVVGGGILLLSMASDFLKGTSSVSHPVPTYSYSPTDDPTNYPSGDPTTSSAPTEAPPSTTEPTITRPTAPRTSTTTKPKRGPTDYEIVSRNRLYATGVMRPTGCKESKARPSTAAGANANYLQLRACLSRAWPTELNKIGVKFRVPTLQIFTGYIQTPCGGMSDTGPPFYCGTNETIYMNLTEDTGNYNRYPEAYNKVWARMWMLHQFAHEFGHHIQNLTGVLTANWDMRYNAPSKAAELEMTRRLELQASCFSDIFIGSSKKTYPIKGQSYAQWNFLIGNTIDLRHDHGNAKNHRYWATRGYQTRNPASCNTFRAPSGRVS